MSKRNCIFCDVCGDEITEDTRRYKFKKLKKFYKNERKFYFKARDWTFAKTAFQDCKFL